jgi:putative ABC transport system substrate-binding protein
MLSFCCARERTDGVPPSIRFASYEPHAGHQAARVHQACRRRGGAAAWPVAARAQQPTLPTIGVLYSVSADEWADRMAAFRQGLGETGFVESRNVVIEYRWAEGRLDRMGWLAADLIGRGVAVILMGGNAAAVRSMLASTQRIPIVFTTGTDPVAAGLVASLNRPGGNATGVTILSKELGPKKFELLHEVVPSAKKIALLVNPNNRVTSEADVGDAKTVTPRLGLEVVVVNSGTQNDIETAFSPLVKQGVGAIYIGSDAVLNSWRAQIAALGLRYKLPTMSSDKDAVHAGQLISYGTNNSEMYRQAGVYVGRILKGEKPGDLPVVQPTKFDLVINLKTAKVLGLVIPESFLLRATEIIE